MKLIYFLNHLIKYVKIYKPNINYYFWNTSNSIYIIVYINRIIMREIKVTMKEIYDAMNPSIERNKKKYNRKIKHKNYDQEKNHK